MTIDPAVRNDLLRDLLTHAYQCLSFVVSWLYSQLAYRGQVGNVYFNVDNISQAHGCLYVRRNAASAYQNRIHFRVDNVRALDRRAVSGDAILAVISAALLEGLQPARVVLHGAEVQFYERAFELSHQDTRQEGYPRSLYPTRVATPAEAGRCIDPSSIIFRSP